MSQADYLRITQAMASNRRKLRNRAINCCLVMLFILTVLNHFKG